MQRVNPEGEEELQGRQVCLCVWKGLVCMVLYAWVYIHVFIHAYILGERMRATSFHVIWTGRKRGFRYH